MKVYTGAAQINSLGNASVLSLATRFLCAAGSANIISVKSQQDSWPIPTR